MNRKEWKELSKVDKAKAHYWYNKAKKKRISKEFESDPRTDKDAKVIHHLIDTEEQRKYNDEHYEMFGFEIDENGNEIFNYGKYVVFWTKEHHDAYHRCSEETRKKISASVKANITEDVRKQIGERSKKMWQDETYRSKMLSVFSSKEHKDKLSKAHLGYTHTEETKKKMSETRKGHETSEETRKKIGTANKGNKARLGMKNSKESNERRSKAMTGRKCSNEAKANMSIAVKRSIGIRSAQFKAYKDSGGELSWNEFQANFKTMFADKFSMGTPAQLAAIRAYHIANKENSKVNLNSFDADIEYLKSIGLYDDNGNVYGSKWFYMEIPNEDLQMINELFAD